MKLHAAIVALVAALAALAAAPCGAGEQTDVDRWLAELEIKPIEGPPGKIDYQFRILPSATKEYDRMVFECVYQQTFPWRDARRRRYMKVHEPVTFLYRRPDVKLTHDLDAYVSFRVPISQELLADMYGPNTFNAEHEVIVDRIRITAEADGETVWFLELPAEGLFDIADMMAKRRNAPVEEEQEMNLDDLDALE